MTDQTFATRGDYLLGLVRFRSDALVLIDQWRKRASELRGDRVLNESARDEADDDMAEVFDECASRLYFVLASHDPTLDTESSASRQHFIETGEYLPSVPDLTLVNGLRADLHDADCPGMDVDGNWLGACDCASNS